MFPAKYDAEIKKAAETYLPGLPWRLLKAQYWQESRLNPDARSPAGAAGVAQFMPATWKEVSAAMGYGVVDRRIAGPAISGGAYYMRDLRRRRTMADMERHKFALASYNAGGGNINRAARLCEGSPVWVVVAECLDEVTGRHSAETRGYVRLIFDKWWPAMEAVK